LLSAEGKNYIWHMKDLRKFSYVMNTFIQEGFGLYTLLKSA
jgi:hypothetical protein